MIRLECIKRADLCEKASRADASRNGIVSFKVKQRTNPLHEEMCRNL